MKILFTVEFYEPRKGGAEEVVKQLAERLVKKGHAVTVATSVVPDRKEFIINGVFIEQFALRGNSTYGIRGSAEEIERYRKLLCGDFDVVLNYAAQIWTTDLAFGVMDSINAKKVFIPCGYSGLRNPAFEEYFEGLPSYLARYDKLIYLSPHYQDKIFGDGHGFAEKGMIIPNGAAEEDFLSFGDDFAKKGSMGKEAHIFISVSNHYVAKGHAFVIEAFKKIKHKDSVLLIVGTPLVSFGIRKLYHFFFDYLSCYFSSLFDHRIRLVDGSDRQRVISVYRAAEIFLFGSRVECAPLVMYESFASKTLFISTEVGNVGDYVGYVKIVNTSDQMAAAADYFLDNPREEKDYTEKAFKLWEEQYTWAKIADSYEKLFNELCQR